MRLADRLGYPRLPDHQSRYGVRQLTIWTEPHTAHWAHPDCERPHEPRRFSPAMTGGVRGVCGVRSNRLVAITFETAGDMSEIQVGTASKVGGGSDLTA
jgi:hypothetical protein